MKIRCRSTKSTNFKKKRIKKHTISVIKRRKQIKLLIRDLINDEIVENEI